VQRKKAKGRKASVVILLFRRGPGSVVKHLFRAQKCTTKIQKLYMNPCKGVGAANLGRQMEE